MNDPEFLVQQFLHECNHLRGYTAATIKNYRIILHAYLKFTKLVGIEAATTDTVRAFILYGRAECGWEPGTTHTYSKKLKVFFAWCVRREYLTSNPALNIELPRQAVSIPKDLSAAQAHRILETVYNFPYPNDYLRYRNHAIFSTYIFAGLRKTELLNLRFTDVDIDGRTIFIYQGKGRKDRILPMNATLALSLKRYLAERNRKRMTAPEFFVSSIKGCAMTGDGLKHIVAQIREASGVQFTIHQLRHTFATLMVEGGCDVISISKMLGHSKIETTMIYAQARPNHLRAVIRKHPLGSYSEK